jgi:hypothetical protein
MYKTNGKRKERNFRKLQHEHGIDVTKFGAKKRCDPAGFTWRKDLKKYKAFINEDGITWTIGHYKSALDARAAFLRELKNRSDRNGGRDRNETKNR